MKVLLVLALVGLVGACKKEVRSERKTSSFEVVAYDPPKRYYVTVKAVDGNQVEQHYISKRCSTWQKAPPVGTVLKLDLTTVYYDDNSQRTSIDNIQKIFCP